MFQNMSKYNFTVKCLNGKNDAEAKIPYGIILWKPLCRGGVQGLPRGRGVGVAKSLEIGHPSKNWNARFGQELLVFYKE